MEVAEYTECADPVEHGVGRKGAAFDIGLDLVISTLCTCRSYHAVFPQCKRCRVKSIGKSN